LTVQSELWTSEKLIDELFLLLVSISESVSNDKGETISVRKYPRRARELCKRIPVARPPPEYIVEKSDLNEKLRTELVEEITSEEARQHILKEAVGRIFENLNSQEYHLSIARNLKVRLV
jgi:hypothetical protein